MKAKREIDLRDIKLLGGIGSIFLLFFPLVGLVLILIALKKFTEETKRETIFRDFLVATAIALAYMFAVFLFWLLFLLIHSVSGTQPPEQPAIAIFFLIIFFLAWIVGTISASYARRSFEALAQVSGESLFSSAGKLFLIGAILLIILVGSVLIFIGEIYSIVAFFTLPDKLEIEEGGAVTEGN
ncbi:DUF996 domain-containing protein [bacterium]|nr:DUF996 domain-containing protein [bacterium]